MSSASAPTMSRAKDAIVCIGAALLRAYLRNAPGRFGKKYLWQQVIQPYIAWRSLPIVARSKFGARFLGSFPDMIHKHIYFFGVWEPAITKFYESVLRSADVVIDMGANVGAHTLLASHLVGPTGRVHAIEASPEIYRQLQRNLDANNAGNVLSYNLAVLDTARDVTVYLNADDNRGATTVVESEAASRGATREASVQGRPLGDIVPLEDLRRARLIKIDVEGAEWFVAQGMKNILPELPPDVQIVMEVNPAALTASGGSLGALTALLADSGFEPFEIENPYMVEFYIGSSTAKLKPLDASDLRQVDVVFRRPQSAARSNLTPPVLNSRS